MYFLPVAKSICRITIDSTGSTPSAGFRSESMVIRHMDLATSRHSRGPDVHVLPARCQVHMPDYHRFNGLDTKRRIPGCGFDSEESICKLGFMDPATSLRLSLPASPISAHRFAAAMPTARASWKWPRATYLFLKRIFRK